MATSIDGVMSAGSPLGEMSGVGQKHRLHPIAERQYFPVERVAFRCSLQCTHEGKLAVSNMQYVCRLGGGQNYLKRRRARAISHYSTRATELPTCPPNHDSNLLNHDSYIDKRRHARRILRIEQGTIGKRAFVSITNLPESRHAGPQIKICDTWIERRLFCFRVFVAAVVRATARTRL